ncbi:MAG TPA: riboflavin synthase [Bacteroidetes bacterium]|nr:riboflavin synthase [Bacteroidota bacterium]
MFTGIIETIGKVLDIEVQGSNRKFLFSAVLDERIQVDQSIAHNGACLTVTEISQNNEMGEKRYAVVAVDETLRKTSLGCLEVGDDVNVERCMKVGQRLDGHFVQGHVDTVGTVTAVEVLDGSWNYHFSFPNSFSNLMVDKGSVTINGVSLTVVSSGLGTFSITIIPFTFEHTNFRGLKVGDLVNLEFDILGKYLAKIYGKE